MQVLRASWVGLIALAGPALGCGGSTDQPPDESVSGASGASGVGGSASGGASAGGGGQAPLAGASAAGGGMVNAGAAGTAMGGAAAASCSAPWPEPVQALPSIEGHFLLSPTFSPDALELIYGEGPGLEITFRRARRASVNDVFPAGEPLPALDAACVPGDWRSVDLSADGLRAYVTCYSPLKVPPLGPASLHVGVRATLQGDFALTDEAGLVGPSASISADDLTLYSSSDIDSGSLPAQQFSRAAIGMPFGKGTSIPGLEQVLLSAPELSSDGLTLYAHLDSDVVMAKRPSLTEPFQAPSVVFAHTGTDQLGSAELSSDCRSLAFLKQRELADGSVTLTLMMSRR